MKALWLRYSAKLDALSRRERISVFLAALGACVYLVFAIGIEPAQRRAQALRNQIAQQKAELEALNARAQLRPRRQADPDAANQARRDELTKRLGELDQTLRTMQRDLVAADRMNALLQEMLARDPGLQLVSLRTLPVTPLIRRGEPAAGGASESPPPKSTLSEANVYKRGVEITVRGGYANLHAYLTRLERSAWRMFWWRSQLTADEDARLTMVITIYTLSLDRAWLQV